VSIGEINVNEMRNRRTGKSLDKTTQNRFFSRDLIMQLVHKKLVCLEV
jgi:hypothetical protein